LIGINQDRPDTNWPGGIPSTNAWRRRHGLRQDLSVLSDEKAPFAPHRL